MKKDVLCAGIATWDTLLSGISPGIMSMDSQKASGILACSGGDAVNACVNFARLGISCSIAACIGTDAAGDLLVNELQKEGVDTSALVRSSSWNTSAPVILVGENGERHIIRIPNTGNAYLERSLIREEAVMNCRHLHIASANMFPKLDGKPMGELLAYAHSLGITTSMDASYDSQGTWERTLRDVIPHLDIFIPSMQEARMFAGTDDIQEMRSFFSGYGLQYFGVKLGAAGVYVTDFTDEYYLDSLYEGTPVDTTGAGDAFFAGFLAGHLRGYDLRSCALIGSAQAASVMRGIGANRTAGTFEDALDLIRSKGESLHFSNIQ